MIGSNMCKHQEEQKILLRTHEYDNDLQPLQTGPKMSQVRRRKRLKKGQLLFECDHNDGDEQAQFKHKSTVSAKSASELPTQFLNRSLRMAKARRRQPSMGKMQHKPQSPALFIMLGTIAWLVLNVIISASNGHQLLVAATDEGQPQSMTDGAEPKPEPLALTSDDNKQHQQNESTNVIIIKYANVTSSNGKGELDSVDQNQRQQLDLELHTLKMYEPLSVAIIESKFSSSIQLFDVSSNQLSTLPNNLFCPLSNEVRQLNISHNLLENFDCLGLISQAGQLCLSELRILDMSYNLIKHLPATGVATLQNLEILNLSNNLIESLDELALSSLFKLTKLDLSSNRIQQLPIRIFHKSTSMQVLRLQSNLLQVTIGQTLLAGLTSLEELDLSHNRISQVNDSAFTDKVNLTRVDLSHNLLAGLRQEVLRVTSIRQATGGYRHRLHHNGQYAGVAPKQTHSLAASAEFLLSSNPFICDCQLDWMRKFQPISAIKRTVLSSGHHHNGRSHSSMMQSDHQYLHHHQADSLSTQLSRLSSSSNLYQNDQPSVILGSSPSSSSSSFDSSTSNNISEITSNQQQQQAGTDPVTLQQSLANHQASAARQPPMATLLANGGNSVSPSAAASAVTHNYARISDLDLIKCTPLFRRNTQRIVGTHHHSYHHQTAVPSSVASTSVSSSSYHRAGGHSRPMAPPDGGYHNHLLGSHYGSSSKQNQDGMIDLLGADSSNFLCRYKSHCFALCQCCEFDACDCEMICPTGCNCFYDSTWQTNIIDCSSNNHTVVPDRIPMDVSGLYLDGNNIDSLRPSNLIARKSLRTLYLNASNLQTIANRTFNGLIELQTLYLNDNMLRTLNGHEFEPLAQLRALYLQSNRLDYISNQTFIYLRSLEILDLSNNRLTSSNLDLFWSIGHHNIRLRQLALAHNWWSCQCNAINRFRQILKQKFLLNGGVNIVDKNQLRCYYNTTTVGPLILADSSAYPNGLQQPLYGSYQRQNQQHTQQTLLTEINQCSELIEDHQEVDLNPPLIQAPIGSGDTPFNTPANDYPNDPFYTPASTSSSSSGTDNGSNYPTLQQQQSQSASSGPFQSQIDQPIYSGPNLILQQPGAEIRTLSPGSSGQRSSSGTGAGGMPLTSFVLLCILMAGIMVIGGSIFLFVRQQQQQQQQHYHHRNNHQHRHNKKSSAASTTSISSGASYTAISSINGVGKQRQHGIPTPAHIHHATLQHYPYNHPHHLIMRTNDGSPASLIPGNGSSVVTAAATIGQRHLQRSHQQNQPQLHNHQHSASSQSNIYAALVSPTAGNTTTVTNAGSGPGIINNHNNLYSNSSTTASHHSGSSSQGASSTTKPNSSTGPIGGGYPQHWQSIVTQNHQQQLRQPFGSSTATLENHYGLNASSQASDRTSSLYNAPGNCLEPGADGSRYMGPDGHSQGHRLKLPKVRQFVSKLVSKSLALGGLRTGSKDELAALASDKIYDAFISYDKRDEPFVVQHLSAELEYGQPQYRIADRYRDLPQPSSAYMAEAISSVIGCSHRTIIVLTENYLSNQWCRYELQAAIQEASADRWHKIIAVILDPKCLLDLDPEMRALLTQTSGDQCLLREAVQQPLVQLGEGEVASQQQLVATLVANQTGGNQQVNTQTAPGTQLATSRIAFINYNERKFWPKLKQLMPTARPLIQTLTLTTKS